MSLRSEFRVVVSVTIYVKNVRFVFTSSCLVGLISYLLYLCLFACSGVQHILCCVFVLFVFPHSDRHVYHRHDRLCNLLLYIYLITSPRYCLLLVNFVWEHFFPDYNYCIALTVLREEF